MKESDLFLPIKNYLLNTGCNHVFGEVLDCDVLALKGDLNIVVEMKTSLNFKVIEQAIARMPYGNYVYVAIPKPKNISQLAIKILKEHRIGLLLVDKYNKVERYLPARFNRHAKRKKKIRERIRPYHASEIGGVKSGEGQTDYSVMIDNIKEFLFQQRHVNQGWISVDDILEHCDIYYKKPRPIVIATLQADWNSNWCEAKTERRRKYFRIRPTKESKF